MNFSKKLLIALLCLLFSCCTKEKTPFDNRLDLQKRGDFQLLGQFKDNNHLISIESRGGIFIRGYNDFRIKITTPNENETAENVTLIPIRINEDGNYESCPHSQNLTKNKQNFNEGFIVFNAPKGYETAKIKKNEIVSNKKESWKIFLSYQINSELFKVEKTIEVLDTQNPNLNMTEFLGNDGQYYYIALISPELPQIAVNELVTGIWKKNNPSQVVVQNSGFPLSEQFSYSVVNDCVLELDPRMPEPDMGNHSSPHNEHLKQTEPNGFYFGKVNYTMTGYWTLNFMLRNNAGTLIKGSPVPPEHRPNIDGIKSELHIDILF